MRTVYEEDKLSIRTAIQNQHHITTYSPEYQGCKVIDIFEMDYLEPLKQFLARKNKTLYAILLARNIPTDNKELQL